MLMDIQKNAGVPAQTSFHLSPLIHCLKWGAHKPLLAEYLAPFLQDRTPRIVVLSIHHFGCLVFPVEALLELAEGREGSEIEWDEWKKHVVIPSTHVPDLKGWVSGCRLFRIASALGSLDIRWRYTISACRDV